MGAGGGGPLPYETKAPPGGGGGKELMVTPQHTYESGFKL